MPAGKDRRHRRWAALRQAHVNILQQSPSKLNRQSVDIPEPYDTIIRLRCAADARYFERHPNRRELVRPLDSGEFWPYQPPAGALVRVVRMWPGARLRGVLV